MTAFQQSRSPDRRATWIGAMAIILWGMLAALTVALRAVPPFQLLAMAFGVAFAAGTSWLLLTGGPARLALFRQPPAYWLLAVAGLYAYHALYFVALRLAPAAEANLINYLWPLLIVLLSALVPGGSRLRLAQLMGAVLGLAATGLLIAGGGDVGSGAGSWPGYAAAFACALVWSSYSVLNRRFAFVPSEAMIGICGIVCLLGALSHILFEADTVTLAGREWLALWALGTGPLGLAFLAWDHGTKHGDLPVLGTLAYCAPVVSTLLLVLLGLAQASMHLIIACCLVVGGAWIATRPPPSGGRAPDRPVKAPEPGSLP